MRHGDSDARPVTLGGRSSRWLLLDAALPGAVRPPAAPNAAFLILERVLQRQERGGGWMRNLKAGHCGCPIPRHRGEASFMVGIMMNGLRRLHQ